MRFVGVLVLMLAGCGTLFSSGPMQVSVSSNPPGAQVLVDGVPVGITPMTTTFKRQTFASHYITVRSPGYEAQKFYVEKSLNMISILNLSSACFWLTDALTGAMIEYSPSSYHLELRPAMMPAPMPMPMPMPQPMPQPMPAPGAPPRPMSQQWLPADHEGLWFVLVNQNHLRTDVSRHGGDYLRTLAGVWRIEYPTLVAAVGERSSQVLATHYAYDFYRELRKSVAL